MFNFTLFLPSSLAIIVSWGDETRNPSSSLLFHKNLTNERDVALLPGGKVCGGLFLVERGKYSFGICNCKSRCWSVNFFTRNFKLLSLFWIFNIKSNHIRTITSWKKTIFSRVYFLEVYGFLTWPCHRRGQQVLSNLHWLYSTSESIKWCACQPYIIFSGFLPVKTFFCLSFKYRRASLRASPLPCTETREFLKSWTSGSNFLFWPRDNYHASDWVQCLMASFVYPHRRRLPSDTGVLFSGNFIDT